MSNNDKNTNQNNQDENLPGYPHYPAKEDITYAENNNGELSLDDENDTPVLDTPAAPTADEDDEVRIVMGTEADVTDEDLRLLNGDSFNADFDDADEDGEPLDELTDTTLNPGSDLDVPGSEDDDANEAIGEEDEENNYYSLGADKEDDMDDSE